MNSRRLSNNGSSHDNYVMVQDSGESISVGSICNGVKPILKGSGGNNSVKHVQFVIDDKILSPRDSAMFGSVV